MYVIAITIVVIYKNHREKEAALQWRTGTRLTSLAGERVEGEGKGESSRERFSSRRIYARRKEAAQEREKMERAGAGAARRVCGKGRRR